VKVADSPLKYILHRCGRCGKVIIALGWQSKGWGGSNLGTSWQPQNPRYLNTIL